MKTEEKPNHWRLEEIQATAEGQHCNHDVVTDMYLLLVIPGSCTMNKISFSHSLA